MNSKQISARGFGQYSIASSFLSRSSHHCKEAKQDSKKKLTSFSDFLNQKLPKTSSILKTIQEKPMPFSSLLSSNESKRKQDKHDTLNKVVFEQFKQHNSDKLDSILTSSSVVVEEEEEEEEEISRKRHNPFQGIFKHNEMKSLNQVETCNGVDEQCRTRKPFLVLGEEDDPQNTKKRGRNQCSTSNNNKKPKSNYNHYANGSGWWDSEMEGVDSEEVGYGEVWEGIGSTTFGGIVDWH